MSKKPTQAEMQIFIDAGCSVADIATQTGWTVSKVRYWLKKFGLKAPKATKSIGHVSFKALLQRYFPAYTVEEEFHIGERLRLDFYIPSLYVGFEINGSQHKEINNLFHSGSWKDFKKQEARDKKKVKLCKKQSILVVHLDDLLVTKALQDPQTAGFLFKEIRTRLAAHEPPKKEKKNGKTIEFNGYRERMKKLSKKIRQENYKRGKALKDKIRGEDKAKALSND